MPLFTAAARVAGSSGVAFDVAAVDGHPDIWLLVNDGAKPGRVAAQREGSDVSTWVAVSSPRLGEAIMATQASAQAGTRSRPSREEQIDAAKRVWQAAAGLLGLKAGQVMEVEPAQRWSAGLPSQPLGVAFLGDAAVGFAACGDWAAGPGLVAAAHSGMCAADAVAARWR